MRAWRAVAVICSASGAAVLAAAPVGLPPGAVPQVDWSQYPLLAVAVLIGGALYWRIEVAQRRHEEIQSETRDRFLAQLDRRDDALAQVTGVLRDGHAMILGELRDQAARGQAIMAAVTATPERVRDMVLAAPRTRSGD